MFKRILSIFLTMSLILGIITPIVNAEEQSNQEEIIVNEYENFTQSELIQTGDNLYFTGGVYYGNKQNDDALINTLSNSKVRSIGYSLGYYGTDYSVITDFLKNDSPLTYFTSGSNGVKTYLDFFSSQNTSTYATNNFYYEIPVNHENFPNGLYDSKGNRVFYSLAPYGEHYSLRIYFPNLLSVDGEYVTKPGKFKLVIGLEEVEFYFQTAKKSLNSPKNKFYNNGIFLNNDKIYINREDKDDLEIYAHEVTREYYSRFVSSRLIPIVDNGGDDIYFDFNGVDFEKYSKFYLVNKKDFFVDTISILNNFCNGNFKMEYRMSVGYNIRFSSDNPTTNSLFYGTGTIFVKKIKNPNQSTIGEYFSEEDLSQLNIVKQKDVFLTGDGTNQRYEISDLLDGSGLYQIKVNFGLDDFKNACISNTGEYNPDFSLTSSLGNSLLLDGDFSENVFLNDYGYLKRYRNVKNEFDNYIYNKELNDNFFNNYYLTLTTTDKENELWNSDFSPFDLEEHLYNPKEDLILNFEYTDFLGYTGSLSKIIKGDTTSLENYYKFDKNYKFVETNSIDEFGNLTIDPYAYIFKDGEYIQYKSIYKYLDIGSEDIERPVQLANNYINQDLIVSENSRLLLSNTQENLPEIESLTNEQKLNLSKNNILVDVNISYGEGSASFFLNDEDLVKYDITMEGSKVVLIEKSNPGLIIIPFSYEGFELENVVKKDGNKFKKAQEIIDEDFEGNGSLFSAYVDRLRNGLQSMEGFQDFVYLNEIFSSSGSFLEIKELELISSYGTNININVEHNTQIITDEIDSEFTDYADEKKDTFKLNLSRISDSISSSITSASLEIKQNYSKISRKTIGDDKKVDFLRNFDFNLFLNGEKSTIEGKNIGFTLSNFIVNGVKIEDTNNKLYICDESNLTIDEIQKFELNCSIVDKNNSEFVTTESDFYIYGFGFDNKNDLNVSFDLNYQSIGNLAE